MPESPIFFDFFKGIKSKKQARFAYVVMKISAWSGSGEAKMQKSRREIPLERLLQALRVLHFCPMTIY
jgi:hypothetical protein